MTDCVKRFHNKQNVLSDNTSTQVFGPPLLLFQACFCPLTNMRKAQQIVRGLNMLI